jgi:ornithine decarboxylase
MHHHPNNLPIDFSLLGRIYAAIMDLFPAQQEFFVPQKTSAIANPTPDQLVDIAIESQISHITKRAVVGGDESFFVADLGQVIRQHRRWMKSLPGVHPYYGMISA